LLFYLGLSLAVAVAAQAKSTAASVIIEVTDQSVVPVPHAQIKLSPVPKAAAKKLETGADGRSSVALRLGSYDLFIARPGFRRHPMHIYLQDAASQTANVVFVGRVLVQKLSIALAMSRPYRPLTDLCD